jgi:tyrosyl-tRNA synthetase
MAPSIQAQLEIIRRGTVQITTESELMQRLEQSVTEGRPLRVKLGIDPTTPDIHLGHTVVLRKLRQFQELGHHVILIIGDFTAMVGDPSDRSKTRPQLNPDQVQYNAKTYLDQASKVLDVQSAEVVYNSSWLQSIRLGDVLKLASNLTVARVLEREEFWDRYKGGVPIGLHEFMYPLLQGYDSIVVRADIELGGTDQTFNLMVGRDLQRVYAQAPQVCITMPILVGLDGQQKMSKSLGNFIGVSEDAFSMYSKVMSLPDAVMRPYFELLTGLPSEKINTLLDQSVTHPMQAKKTLAEQVMAPYHNVGEIKEASLRWDTIFSKKGLPHDIPVLELSRAELEGGKIWIVKLVALTGITSSHSQARRLVQQGGVELGGIKFTDPELNVEVKDSQVLRVGKKGKFFRIRIR